jgi:histidinol-phosphate phosphatase family protein
VRLLPAVAPALRALARAGFALVVVSNQAAIGRGLVRAEDVRAVNARLRRRLRIEGVELAGIFVCPHRPEDACACRKPEPGLLLEAARTLGLDLARSWLVGDSTRDLEAAARAGVPALLLRTGWGGRDPGAEAHGESPRRAEALDDLMAAARRILRGNS